MTGHLVDDLVAAGPVLTDGAWGTQLSTLGLAAGEQAELWNLNRPDGVEAVARSYVEAGSRVILTNTFQGNRIALRDAASDVEAINRAGTEISRLAAGEQAHVFASMGPSNKMLFTGETDEAELRDVFTEQAAALAGGGADGLVIETMSDLAEAVIAVGAARTTGLPVVACMTYDTGKKCDRTMMGVTPDQAAKELEDAGADVVGANCGVGIDLAAPICAALVGATERPVWMKANAGLPDLVDRQVVYLMTPEQFAGHALGLVEEGAAFVGGCCGTTPEFIAALAQKLG